MGSLSRIAKLREIASGFYLDDSERYYISRTKLDSLLNLIESIGDEQIIIWCNFKFEIETIKNELLSKGKTVVTAYSKDGNKIDQNIRNFKDGSVQYLIAHPASVKFGLTFTNCHYAIYNSLSYSLQDHYQSHDRIYRKGQDKKCFYYYLISQNTIDEDIYQAIVKKQKESVSFEQIIKKASKYKIDQHSIDEALKVQINVKKVVLLGSI